MKNNFLYNLRHLFKADDARRTPSVVKKLASKFIPREEKDDNGNKIYYRRFDKQQLVGALIRVNKHLAYRVVKGAELTIDGKMVDGEHELIKVKLR